MTTPALVIFDDGRGQWGPVTDLRPVFAVRSGAMTARLRIERCLGRGAEAVFVPRDMQAIAEHDGGVIVNRLPGGDTAMLVNGRWLGAAAMKQVAALQPNEAIVQADGQVIAACLPRDAAQTFADGNFAALPATVRQTRLDKNVLIERPWHIIAQLEATLGIDLPSYELPPFNRDTPLVPSIGEHDIRVSPSAKLHPMVLLNCEKGPIVIDDEAIVGSFAVLAGPCYIGVGAIVTPHAHVRSCTVVGRRCIVGGEVSFSILDAYSNKCHAGYLGHALVGRWVNLGADTTVSNLKNTYGSVRMQLAADTPAEDTGLNKLGPVIGDFVRTAIGVRVNTGSCLGTASMVALSGFTPKFIDRLTFATDAGMERYDIDKFLATAGMMMSRRKQTLSPAAEARLRSLSAR